MSVASRLTSLERRHSGDCDGGIPKLLFCRDPGVPVPPPVRCGRIELRLIFHPGPPLPGEIVEREPAWQVFNNLRDFYGGTARRMAADIPDRAVVGGAQPGGAP